MNRNLLQRKQHLWSRLVVGITLSSLVFISLYCGLTTSRSTSVTIKHFSEYSPLVKPLSYNHYVKHGHAYSTAANDHNTFQVSSYQELGHIFSETGFQLPEQKSLIKAYQDMYVPRLYLVALPRDFNKASLTSKKRLFLKSLLPIVLRVNEDILKERRQLLWLIHDQTRNGCFSLSLYPFP